MKSDVLLALEMFYDDDANVESTRANTVVRSGISQPILNNVPPSPLPRQYCFIFATPTSETKEKQYCLG